MSKNYTDTFLRIQGHRLDAEALAEIGHWMRWPYVLYASTLTVGVALATAAIRLNESRLLLNPGGPHVDL